MHTSCNGIHHANKLSYQYHLMTSASSKNLTFQYRYDTDLRLNRISIENITMLRYFITEHINFEMNSDMNLQDATIVSIYQKDYPTVNEVYDKDKKIRKKEFDDNWMIYHYDDENRLKEIQSNNSSLQHSYLYNAYGQMVLEYSENTTKSYGYDTYKRLDSYNIHQENIQLMQTFTYVDDYHDMIQENSLSSGHLLSYQYDMAQRVRQETLELNNFTMTQEYTYDRNEENISPFIRIHSINKNQNSTDTYSYEYNEMGQITKIKNNRYEIHYTYDALNRLIREDNPMFNKTYFFTYDDNGNIITKSIFNFTFDEHLSNPIQVNTYSYGHGEWNDQLIAYNGQVIQYDNAGKPIQYRGHEITWDNYRNIESIQINDEDTLSLSTKVGLGRVEKDSHFGRFILQNDLDKVYYMRVSLSENESEWKFRYSLDKLIGFNYNGDEYIYQRNIQGDITHILDLDGNVICEYVYDAWGNHLVLLGNGAIDNNPSSIGNINPFRYRGYFYDVETGFYWLLSRYYDPEIGRFISPDSVDYLDPQSINGLNLYAYCGNDPVNRCDPTGHFFVSALLIGALVGGIIGAGTSLITQGITNGWDNINGWQVLLDGTIGVASGLLSTTGIGTIGAALISGGLGFAGSVGGDLIASNGDWSSINWTKVAVMGVVNFGLGAWAGAGSQNSATLGKGLLKNGEVNKTFGILYNATKNYLTGNISKRGFAGVFNLYGNQFINAVSKALPGTVARLTTINLGKLGIATIISGGASIGLNYLL